MDELLSMKILNQVKNAGPCFLNILMLALIDIKDQHMDFAAIIREICGDLFTAQ